METTIVKIEAAYISLAGIYESGNVLRVDAMRRVILPDGLRGEAQTENPEALSDIIISAMVSGGMNAENVAIYLGSCAERHLEYRYSEAADTDAKKERAKQAKDELLADTEGKVWRTAKYRYHGTEEGLGASAVFAAEADFCERLVKAFENTGYTVVTLSSALAAFAEMAKLVSDIGDRVLVLGTEKREFRAALFIGGKLARLESFPRGTESEGPGAPLLQFVTEETKVVLCGFESQKTQLHEMLKQAGASAIGLVSQKMKGPKSRLALAGELAYQDNMFPGVFAAAALPDQKKAPKIVSYIPKEQADKKRPAAFVGICAVALAVAVFICALPPVTLALAERDRDASMKRLEDPFYNEAYTKLENYRKLVSEYTELAKTEEAMPERDPSYASTIDELKEALLMTATITEMYYEEGTGILIDFTTKDVEIFDMAKNVANESRRMSVYEPAEREETEDGEWRIQIRVTLTPSAWEAPQ